MNTFKHILSSLSIITALIVMVGCANEINYTEGAVEDPNCYGVYFPKNQPTKTDLEFEPGTQTKVTYTVRRRNAVDPIVVPVAVESNFENIFIVEPIAFDAGEDETTFSVSFPKAEMGPTYTCDIKIEDSKYASIYSPDKSNLSISLVIAKWDLVTDLKTDEKKGHYRDDILGSFIRTENPNADPNPEIELEIYERSDKKGYYRMKAFTSELFNMFVGGPVNWTNNDAWFYVDASDPDKVYIPYQTTGFTAFPEMGEMNIASQTPENFVLDEGAAQYGILRNGIITFPAQGINLEPTEGEYAGRFLYANIKGLERIMLPGARVFDYSVALSKSEPENGVVKIGATFSKDTREFRYAIFTGSLSDGEASLRAQDIADGKIDNELIKTISSSGEITVENLSEGTGKYTLVGCIYGLDENSSQEGGESAAGNLTMQGYASIPFGYIKAGEDAPVILTIGLEATQEYAGQGITTDNSAKFYAYGEDIESIRYGVFKAKDLKALKDTVAFLRQMGKDFTKEQLDAINDKHYSIMLTGLNGDTEYTFAGLAYNGYVSKLFSKSIKTTGKFNPGLESEFLYSDFLEEQPVKEELISTKWNYYAINLLDEKVMRRKIGTVTIEGTPESNRLTISGLTGATFDNDPSTNGGKIPAVYVPAEPQLADMKGAISPILSEAPIGTIYGEDVMALCVAEDLNLYTANYPFIGGAVADGYIYFVPTPAYVEQGVTFRYLYTLSYSTPYSILTDMLLVDPKKDMGGIPELATKKISELRRAAAKLRTPQNYVERIEFQQSEGSIGSFFGGSYENISVSWPTDYAKGFLPASAPETKAVKARTGFSDATGTGCDHYHASGSGPEFRLMNTAAADVRLRAHVRAK